MLLQIQDADARVQQVVAHAQDVAIDGSGTISDSAQPQQVFAQNGNRSGFLFQNIGSAPMQLNEIGPAAQGSGSWLVNPGQYFPPYPGYAVPTGIISVKGSAGDSYTARQW